MKQAKITRIFKNYPYIYKQKFQKGFRTPVLTKKKGIFKIKGKPGVPTLIQRQSSVGAQQRKFQTRQHRKLVLNSSHNKKSIIRAKKSYLNEKSQNGNGKYKDNCEEKENLFEKHFQCKKNRTSKIQSGL